MIIFALTNGYLDDIPTKDVTRFESELNQWAKSNASDLLNEIKTSGKLPESDKFDSVLSRFKETFSKSED